MLKRQQHRTYTCILIYLFRANLNQVEMAQPQAGNL